MFAGVNVFRLEGGNYTVCVIRYCKCWLTVPENLGTLCFHCNRGKRNSIEIEYGLADYVWSC